MIGERDSQIFTVYIYIYIFFLFSKIKFKISLGNKDKAIYDLVQKSGANEVSAPYANTQRIKVY